MHISRKTISKEKIKMFIKILCATTMLLQKKHLGAIIMMQTKRLKGPGIYSMSHLHAFYLTCTGAAQTRFKEFSALVWQTMHLKGLGVIVVRRKYLVLSAALAITGVGVAVIAGVIMTKRRSNENRGSYGKL
ncbi:uncharacterized protein LOC135339060 isoform X2 [Halichondria panicea]|uniref:uncharacterized protein LOC135339060 isoform X2 n=1 Tax=Halichondria panicea TaxID=6063 RepID=UPI00312B5EC3